MQISFYLFIIIIILLTTCVTFIAAYELQKVVAQASRTNDQSASFTIENPPRWKEIKGNSSHNIIIFRAPMVNGTGIGIYAANLPYSNVSLSEYSMIHINSLNQTYDILQHNTTLISNMPAYQAMYADPAKGTTALEIWTIEDDMVFRIIYLAGSRHFAYYLNDAKDIMNSFQFT